MLKLKIYYHHTDSGGVVYYANYLKFLEEARTEFFLARGISVKELADSGTLFTVCRQEIDYKAPAFYGDTLAVDTRIAEAKGVRLVFEHEIKNQDARLICQAKTTLACVGCDFKPKPIPDSIRNKLS